MSTQTLEPPVKPISTTEDPPELPTDSVLYQFGSKMGNVQRHVIGREAQIDAITATMMRAEQRSILLLGPAGIGKTATVEDWAFQMGDQFEVYNIDITAMGNEGPNMFASRIHLLVDDLNKLSKTINHPLVLFIDEVHMLGMPGYATGLEALKPAMARGLIQLIGSTTDEEYVQYIEPNSAFNRRFQRLDIPVPDNKTIVKILEDMHRKYVSEVPVQKGLYELIIKYGKYIPQQSQPSKSIDLFDAMIGWHNSKHVSFTRKLLNRVVYQKTGANPDWKVDVPKMMTYLRTHVLDQNMAMDALEGAIYTAIEHLNDESRPKGTFMMVGSTGVGKTETVRTLAKAIFGTEDAMIRFDMSEYQTKNSVDRFREMLADRIQKRPFAVVLFDEIEKASNGVRMLLLQITDDGRLSDRYGREVSFLDSYIFMTSNTASDIVRSVQNNGETINDFQQLLQSRLKDVFPPELLGRLDAIIPFTPLSRETYYKLATLRCRQLATRLSQRGILLKLNEQILTYLVGEHFDVDSDAGGGRALQARIRDEVVVPIAKVMNAHPDLKVISLNVYGKMAQLDKKDIQGSASIGVMAFRLDDGTTYEGRVKDEIQATDKKAKVTPGDRSQTQLKGVG